jgi:hypothetical protein
MKYLPLKQSILIKDGKYSFFDYEYNHIKCRFTKLNDDNVKQRYFRILLRTFFIKYLHNDIFINWEK